MNLDEIIRKEMEKYGDKIVICEIPEDKCPTPESMLKLNAEIRAAAEKNDAMMARSWEYASNNPVIYRRGVDGGDELPHHENGESHKMSEHNDGEER